MRRPRCAATGCCIRPSRRGGWPPRTTSPTAAWRWRWPSAPSAAASAPASTWLASRSLTNQRAPASQQALPDQRTAAPSREVTKRAEARAWAPAAVAALAPGTALGQRTHPDRALALPRPPIPAQPAPPQRAVSVEIPHKRVLPRRSGPAAPAVPAHPRGRTQEIVLAPRVKCQGRAAARALRRTKRLAPRSGAPACCSARPRGASWSPCRRPWRRA